jgi:hypothetical protein
MPYFVLLVVTGQAPVYVLPQLPVFSILGVSAQDIEKGNPAVRPKTPFLLDKALLLKL